MSKTDDNSVIYKKGLMFLVEMIAKFKNKVII